MGSTTSFRGSNYGSQIGANYGSVTNEFHLPWDLDDKLSPAHGATFDSYADQHEDQCLPGTRTDLLSQISEWASSPQGKCIFWLNGIAGTGKSTISRTVAKSFSLSQSLGASFFFKRGEGDRGNARKLFPTIARHLAVNIPEIAPALQETVRENPGIITKTMREQFDKLLLQPLRSLERSKIPIQARVIVIDALDECEGDSDIRLILQLLPQLQNIAATRLRVLLTSRPDLPIRLGFLKIADDDHKDFVLHDIPLEVIKHDISRFFDHRLTEIRKERFLPSDWPGEEGLQKLVALSAPLFIFAATICRIFNDPVWDPRDSLEEILNHKYDQSKLDQTYLPILNRLINTQHEKYKAKLVSEFQQVIGAIVILESPLSIISLSKLLGIEEGLIYLRLSPLHSVLEVPDDQTIPIRLFHQSFRDYLLDPETRKKSPFGVNKTEIHYRLAIQCLMMCENLRKNICGLPSDGTVRTEIDRQAIHRSLPPELQYACRYWVHHLTQCNDLIGMIHDAFSFLRIHFLHWVEVMSLLGLTSEILGILDRLQTATSNNESSSISSFLHDAKRFILKSYQIIDQAPLQIYCAGLIFAPRTAIIREEFKEKLPTWICQLPQVEKGWGPLTQALEGHLGSVYSVAFSPDGRLLASGSLDSTVRLWDTVTGALIQTLKGHWNSVQSVAFSPDGRLLASGSRDKTVRLWDPVTGALTQTLEGHFDSFESVAFSPDGRLLASGSLRDIVRLWNPVTGALIQTFKGHRGSAPSVVLSPDGRLLESGTLGGIIRLWDPVTGALTQTLKGHSCLVHSVASSPDGRLLATGSLDRTVQLWDSATGMFAQALKGHFDSVESVAFSPDGRLLASGSLDSTVRLWDPVTGALIQTFKGHWGSVQSVAFSPDGRLLASGSLDGTVRLWDPVTSEVAQMLERNFDSIESVAFSPDGRILASGAHDKTVRLWNPVTGALTQTLEGHSRSVRLVTFSPNGRFLASGSLDGTVRLWDPVTGAPTQTFECGHWDSVQLMTFSPNSRLLALSNSLHGKVWLWNPVTGVLTQTLEGNFDSIESVAFSPDGRLLALGSKDNTVRIWDLVRGALAHTLEGHSRSVQSVAFSPDSRLLATGSLDRRVRLWDSATGALAQTKNVEEGVTQLDFSYDGLYLHTNSGILDLSSRYDIPIFYLPYTNLRISIERDRWIMLNGKKVLWLPVEFRPTCSQISGNTVALGHASGRVSFIGFCM